MEPTNDTGPIMPYNDRRIHDVAPALEQWFDQQLARPEDDPPPLDEMDRLLGILGHTAPDLPDEAKMRLATAWAATFRLAVGWGRQQVAKEHGAALERMAGLWSALGEDLADLALTATGNAPAPDRSNAALAGLARQMMRQAATLETRLLMAGEEDKGA